MDLNQILRKKRKEHHFTQEQLAEKLLVSPKTISNWETGRTFPDIEKKTRLAVLKRYVWMPSILSIILILVVSQQNFLGKLSGLTTGLILVSIALNGGIIFYFSNELSSEKGEKPEFQNKQQVKGLIIFTILFVASVIVGYIMKYRI